MLKTVADISQTFSNFINGLNLSLSKPQLRHVTQVAETLIVNDSFFRLLIWGSIFPCNSSNISKKGETPVIIKTVRLFVKLLI